MSEYLPLATRRPDDIVAIRGERQITFREYLAQVVTLADALPEARFAANLCADKYCFMVAFAAAIVRGQANLLLPSRRPAVIKETLEEFDDCCVMHDGDAELTRIQGLDVRSFADSIDVVDVRMPMIVADQLSAVVYTSGSTGASARIDKSWRTLVDGTMINIRYAFRDIDGPVGVIATVPPWHMYGLEYAVLSPLFFDARSYAGNTLFPGDILNGAERTPVDRILVSTPVHLRALVRSGLTFPAIKRVLCATAPLTRELAIEVAERLQTDICELYGCSEAGCLAYRDPVLTSEWRFFDEFTIDRDGQQVQVDAAHLEESVTLFDDLSFGADDHFKIEGRGADLVKIGGKRGSLAEITNRLLGIEGVEDAVVFSPDSEAPGDGNEARLTALVVCPDCDLTQVRDELARVIDPVFQPRPIYKVESLPRNQTGKILKADLQRLIEDRRT
jgi:acyl-coenzyme A synthetase/AMP-(fatty) acid ligase